MDMMGWSNSTMVRRYVHVTARLRRPGCRYRGRRMGGWCWPPM